MHVGEAVGFKPSRGVAHNATLGLAERSKEFGVWGWV